MQADAFQNVACFNGDTGIPQNLLIQDASILITRNLLSASIEPYWSYEQKCTRRLPAVLHTSKACHKLIARYLRYFSTKPNTVTQTLLSGTLVECNDLMYIIQNFHLLVQFRSGANGKHIEHHEGNIKHQPVSVS